MEYQIRRMDPSEVQIAVEWAAREGWNPGVDDAELFSLADPDGFFAGEVNGQVVSVGSAVCYDDEYAFCGLYIVDPEFRGRGLGLALTKARLAYCGDRNVGIDGVLENVEIYRRVGYEPYHMNHRYQITATSQRAQAEHITKITAKHLPEILKYDRRCFPSQRNNFLQKWIQQPHGRAVVSMRDERIQGFAVRRECRQGYKIGPLFADDSEVANGLFVALQQDIPGEVVFLDVPENNPAAMDLARSHSMEEVFATMRMYQKGLPKVEHDKIFGITTFELG